MTSVKHNSGKSNNRELSNIFHRMAGLYRYLGAGQRFRALAYENASRTLSGLKEDISYYASDVKSLDKLSGIGESIAEKIIEYLCTGKIGTYEKLKKEIPESLLELMDISGFGPATVKMLHEEFKINNKEELLEALSTGKLADLKGFGKKKIENLKRGLKIYKEEHGRKLLPDAWEIGNGLLQAILSIDKVLKAEITGSLRRKKETIGDIDIIITAERKNWTGIINKILKIEQVGNVLAKGVTKLSFLTKKESFQVDIRIVETEEYGAALLYFTGSKEHNLKLRLWAKEKGWKLNEYGLYDIKTNKKLAGKTEAETYSRFRLAYIPPELREDRGEFEAARRNELPLLIETKDIRGDMHMHSKWSDGTEKIETIAAYIRKAFPRYKYIVITDHSPSERIAHGLQEAEFEKQFSEIDDINKKLKRSFIKKGVEVDILADGSLDLPDNLLKKFDWVVASIHSGFQKDNTQRLLRACEHPLVHCIGHPGGRLIGKREAYPVDWPSLFRKMVETGTAVEINSQPERLDLNDILVKEAIEMGVTITISSDSHGLKQFDYMELGVAVARRGWCQKENILNTQRWKKIEVFKNKKFARLRKR